MGGGEPPPTLQIPALTLQPLPHDMLISLKTTSVSHLVRPTFVASTELPPSPPQNKICYIKLHLKVDVMY